MFQITCFPIVHRSACSIVSCLSGFSVGFSIDFPSRRFLLVNWIELTLVLSMQIILRADIWGRYDETIEHHWTRSFVDGDGLFNDELPVTVVDAVGWGGLLLCYLPSPEVCCVESCLFGVLYLSAVVVAVVINSKSIRFYSANPSVPIVCENSTLVSFIILLSMGHQSIFGNVCVTNTPLTQ